MYYIKKSRERVFLKRTWKKYKVLEKTFDPILSLDSFD